MTFSIRTMVCVAALAVLAGCTTEASKKAMNKPLPTDQYAGFGAGTTENSKRKAEKPKQVRDDMEPEQAVSILVDQLKKTQAGYSVTAEEQLMYWGERPGVGPIVARKVRPLLKSDRVEHRAPALRLTVAYGNRDSVGDLIECLTDKEYGIRDAAFRAVQNYVPRDFGYDPSSGEVARAQSVDQYRRWYQYKTRNEAVQPPSIYEKNPPTEAQVVQPKRDAQTVFSGAEVNR
ncbi:MAG: hypothetical protein WCT04_17130 [Planctomycetota bacterium]